MINLSRSIFVTLNSNSRYLLNFNHSNKYTLSKQNFTIIKNKNVPFFLSIIQNIQYTSFLFFKTKFKINTHQSFLILILRNDETHTSKKNHRKLR